MDIISKGQVDTSVIVGVIVVLAIVSAAGFGIYYFGFVRPRQKQIQKAKESAQIELEDTLGSVETSQAEDAAARYRAKIEEAETKSKVTSLVSEITTIYQREKTREELLNMAEDGSHGSFYTLDELYENLREEINSKSTTSQLKTLRDTIEEQLNNAWDNLHREAIQGISDEGIVMVKKNSLIEESYYESKENALEYVEEKKWDTLRGIEFRARNTFMIPIIDTFNRAPSVDPGDSVDIYEYNSENDKMTRRVTNTEVLNVIYPKDTLSSISWSMSDGGQSYSFSTDVWRQIKASEAGDSNADGDWDDWAQSVIKTAREEANLGDYELEAIYVVEITEDDIAKDLTHIEQFQSGTKELVLVVRK